MTSDIKNPRTSWLPSFRRTALILLIALIATWCGWYFYAKHEMNLRFEKLTAAGEPLDIKEWYAQAEANLPKERSPHADEILGFLYDLKVEDFHISVGTSNPILSDALGVEEEILYNDWPDHVVEDAEKVLEANAELLQQIKEIAAYPPVHPSEAILYKQSASLPAYPIPDLLAIRGIMSLLKIKSMNAFRVGDLDSAIASQETAYRMVEHYEVLPPSLINAMISVAMRSIINKSTAEILNAELLNAEHCKRVAAMLKNRYPQGRMYATFRFTQMETNENYVGMMNDNDSLSQEFGRPYSLLNILFKTVLRPYIYQDATAYMDAMERFLETLKSYEDSPWKTLDPSQNQKYLESLEWYYWASMMSPNLDRSCIQDMSAHSYHIFLETSIALKLHQLDFGNYPDSLNDLIPKYLEKAPLDLFDGNPLRYKKVDQGFLLWSVGEDLMDDGGALDEMDPCTMQTNDDLVMQLGNL